jgi:hypothetical protein
MKIKNNKIHNYINIYIIIKINKIIQNLIHMIYYIKENYKKITSNQNLFKIITPLLKLKKLPNLNKSHKLLTIYVL